MLARIRIAPHETIPPSHRARRRRSRADRRPGPGARLSAGPAVQPRIQGRRAPPAGMDGVPDHVPRDRSRAGVGAPAGAIGVNRFLLGVGGDLSKQRGEPEFLPSDAAAARQLSPRRGSPASSADPSGWRPHACGSAMPVRLHRPSWPRLRRRRVGFAVDGPRPFKRWRSPASGARSHVFPRNGAFDFSDRETMWMLPRPPSPGSAKKRRATAASYVTFSAL